MEIDIGDANLYGDVTQAPWEMRERLLALRKKALAEALTRQREGLPMPQVSYAPSANGPIAVAPHPTQVLAGILQPLLDSAKTRAQIEQLKKDESEFYTQNKTEADKFFANLLGATQKGVVSTGNNPSAVTTGDVPDPAARVRVAAQGVNLPGAAGDVARRTLIEQLFEEPKRQEATRIRTEDREDRQQAARDQAAALVAFKEAEAERNRIDRGEQLAADRATKAQLAGMADATRRAAIEAAADKAEAKVNAAKQAKQADSQEMLNLLATAREIVPKATSSGVGAARDAIAGVFGKSTDAADAAAKLKAIGGMLTAKVPRMEGPQSNYDLKLYQEMAGRIGDPTVPVSQRLAAIDTLEELHKRYANMPVTASPRGQSGTVKRFNPATGRLE